MTIIPIAEKRGLLDLKLNYYEKFKKTFER